ncbi:MAG TPA: neuraminidase-like domain-containing protein [Rubricoccaceae bacterium]|jgi:hypothetical protein
MSDYLFHGRLTDAAAGSLLSDLRVECWDRDSSKPADVYLAGAVSKAGGAFELSFDDDAVAGFAGGRRPNLFFRVFSGPVLVDSTEDVVLGTVEPGEHDVAVAVRFPPEVSPLAELAPSAPAPRSAYQIDGTVTSGGEPVPDLDIRVSDPASPGAPVLAASRTGAKGVFSVVLARSTDERLADKAPLGLYRFTVAFADGTTQDVDTGVVVGTNVEINVSLPALALVGSPDTISDIAVAVAGKSSNEKQLADTLASAGILSLGDVRRAGGLPAALTDEKGAETLVALAELDAVVPDPTLSALLIGAGIDTVDALASASVPALENALDAAPGETDALRDAARSYATTRDAFLMDVMMAAAEGRDRDDTRFDKESAAGQVVFEATKLPCLSTDGCMDAAGPVAYLAALVGLVSRSLMYGGQPVTAQTLADRLHLDVFDLPGACDTLNREVLQSRLVAEVLARQAPSGAQRDALLKEYAAGAAYPALLAEMGTSYEELASVRGQTAAQRRLASRLGLPGHTALSAYVLDTASRTPEALRNLFGLAPFLPTSSGAPAGPRLLADRAIFLRRQWWAQDWGDARALVSFPVSEASRASLAAPVAAPAVPVDERPYALVDPGVVEAGDLRTLAPGGTANPALALWTYRHGLRTVYADGVRAGVAAASSPGALASIFDAELDLNRTETGSGLAYSTWEDLFGAVEAGRSLGDTVARLDLRPEEVPTLAQAYRAVAGGTLGESTVDAIVGVLVDVGTRRQAAAWRAEEHGLALTLSPDVFVLGGEGPAGRSVWQDARRRAWEHTLRARFEQERALGEAVEAVVLGAEAVALQTQIGPDNTSVVPGLLALAFLNGGADVARAEFLVDPDVGATVRTTRLAQATSVVQTLLGRAHDTGAVRGMTLSDAPGARDDFEALWRWMGTYDSWRAAMGSYLFPENTALSYVRPERTGAYDELIKALRPGRVSGTDVAAALEAYAEYTEELMALWPTAACYAMVKDDPSAGASGSSTRYCFSFAYSWRTNRVFWSATPDEADGAPRKYLWAPLPGVPEPVAGQNPYRPIGAAPYEVEGGNRYVCLLLQSKVDPAALLYRFDLDRGEWVTSESDDDNESHTRVGYPIRLARDRNGPIDAVLMTGPTELVTGSDGKRRSPDLYVAYHVPWHGQEIYRDRLNMDTLQADPAPFAKPFRVNSALFGLQACGRLASEIPFTPTSHVSDEPANLYAVTVRPAAQGGERIEAHLHVMDSRIQGAALSKPVGSMSGWSPVGVMAPYGSRYITILTKGNGTSAADARTFKSVVNIEAVPHHGLPVIADFALTYVGTNPAVGVGAGRHPMVLATEVASVVGGQLPFPSDDTLAAEQTWISASHEGYISFRVQRSAGSSGQPNAMTEFIDVRRLAPRYIASRILPVTPGDRRDRQLQMGWAFEGSYAQDTYIYLEESFLAVPLLMAERARRDRQTETALSWYGTLYDETSDVPYIYPPLAPNFALPPRTIVDPLSPHAMLGLHPEAQLRHVLAARARVLLDAADASFSQDTPESVDRARGLYDRARRTLAHSALGDPDRYCRESVAAARSLLDDGTVPRQWSTPAARVLSSLESIPTRQARSNAAEAVALAFLDKTLGWDTRLVAAALVVAQAQAGSAPALGDVIDEHRRVLRDARRAVLALPTVSGRLDVAVRKMGDVGLGKRVGTSSSGRSASAHVGAIVVPPAGFVIPPNPVVRGLRLRARVNLDKVHQGRNMAGLERPLHIRETGLTVTSNSGIAVRRQPTAYRAGVLIDRARQQAQLAQQAEAAFLTALERFDAESYAALQSSQQLELTGAGVTLQGLRLQEATDGVALAMAQVDRAAFQVSHFASLQSSPAAALEEQSLAAMTDSISFLDTVAGASTYDNPGGWMGALAGLASGAFTGARGASVAGVPGAVIGGLIGGFSSLLGNGAARRQARASTASAKSQAASARAALYSQQASLERRRDDWAMQGGLAQRDVLAAQQGIRLAGDRVAIAGQEREIALLQALHASETAVFLSTKFTNAALYQWMSSILEDVFAFYVHLATATARLALDQLSFERQAATPRLIAADYATATDEAGDDRRGLTGSARLLADITELEQYAFETDRRALQLSTTVSLVQHDPVAFERFRQSGVLPFALPMEEFDRDFPGHHLRLVRGVAVSVVALVPPTRGIRATLASTGLSTVVVEEDSVFRSVQVRRDPDLVALTSPIGATGVLQLESNTGGQLRPFEGAGVDVGWEFRLPKAANPFDYRSIADVLLTLEFTAFDSPVYQTQVLGQLDPEVQADRPFSLRDDAADAWYDLLNPALGTGGAVSSLGDEGDPLAPTAPTRTVTWTTTRDDFPPHLADLTLRHVQLYFVRADGETAEVPGVKLAFTPTGKPQKDVFGQAGNGGASASTREGLLSTRRPSAVWSPSSPPIGTWALRLGSTALAMLADERVEDILLVVSFEGVAPAWPV